MSVELMTERGDIFFQARIYCIKTAIREEFDVLGPQTPQWLREGVRLSRQGVDISPQKLREIDSYGGTDHPDPTLRSDG